MMLWTVLVYAHTWLLLMVEDHTLAPLGIVEALPPILCAFVRRGMEKLESAKRHASQGSSVSFEKS